MAQQITLGQRNRLASATKRLAQMNETNGEHAFNCIGIQVARSLSDRELTIVKRAVYLLDSSDWMFGRAVIRAANGE
jgi:hypothetical protein